MLINVTRWTSELIIMSNEDFDLTEIDSILNNIESRYSKFNSDESILTRDNYDKDFLLAELYHNKDHLSDVENFASYKNDGTLDFTGMLKGLAIQMIHKYLSDVGATRILINFGGDIYGQGLKTTISVSDNVKIETSENAFVCFTSGTDDRRGSHIIPSNKSIDTVTVYSELIDPIKADMIATRSYALNEFNDYRCEYIRVKDEYPVFDKIYCASPFFDENQISIRDKMVSHINPDCIFRPDLTDNSRAYDKSPGKELADLIFRDNVNGIINTDQLMYPMNTDDLGTLFEVGKAISLNHQVVKFNADKDEYIFINMSDARSSMFYFDQLIVNDFKLIIKCNTLASAVALGYLSSHADNIYYDLCGLHDNIMLSQLFTRVEPNEVNKYRIVTRDNWSEID